MQDYPHIYKAGAYAGSEGEVTVTSPRLSPFQSTSPPEFGGPEGTWSPETLLVASVVDCFVLTFRAVARASSFEWQRLECEADGKLEKVDRQSKFTEFRIRARLIIPPDAREDRAERLLQKAEAGCLITNSLSAEVHLETRIEQGTDQRAA